MAGQSNPWQLGLLEQMRSAMHNVESGEQYPNPNNALDMTEAWIDGADAMYELVLRHLRVSPHCPKPECYPVVQVAERIKVAVATEREANALICEHLAWEPAVTPLANRFLLTAASQIRQDDAGKADQHTLASEAPGQTKSEQGVFPAGSLNADTPNSAGQRQHPAPPFEPPRQGYP